MSYAEGLVGFIDILGTRATLDFATKYALHTAWHTQAREVEGREKSVFRRTLARRAYSFSDCAYFTYIFKEDVEAERRKPERLWEAVTTLLTPVQIIMDHGFLVRGGICYGQVFADDLGLFGPAVEESYRLESENAVYPRIILDDNIGEKLFTLELNHEAGLILHDTDGKYYVNPFYGIVKNNHFGGYYFDGDKFFDKLDDRWKDIIEGDVDERIKEKWEWFHARMESELQARE